MIKKKFTERQMEAQQEWVTLLPKDLWIPRDKLEELWKTKPTTSVNRIPKLLASGLLRARGGGRSREFYVAESVVLKKGSKSKPAKTVGSIDNLIAAASDVGAENERYRYALKSIQDIITTTLSEG